MKALTRVERRETKSLDETFQWAEVNAGRGADNRMPALPDWLLGKRRDTDADERKGQLAATGEGR